MFEDYISALAGSCKATLNNMTRAIVSGVTVEKKEDGAAVFFPLCLIFPYEDDEKKTGGDFAFGFGDEAAAVFVASAVSEKAGLPPVERFDADAADIVGEFMNIAAGSAVSEWEAGSDFRFGPPVPTRRKRFSADSGAESFEIVLVFSPIRAGGDRKTSSLALKVVFKTGAEDEPEGKRILVVDDSALARKILGNALNESGYSVAVAKDGLEAVEKHREFAPDLTVMDITMPNMGGLDAMVKIRESVPNAKFIVLTSTARTDEVVTAATLNVMAYVVKTGEVEEFLAKVKMVFE